MQVADVMRPPVFVPDSKPLDTLLAEMQRDRNHMALLVDEYGGIAGLVTIEDVLEEIVGEIADEYDTDEIAPIEDLGDGKYRVSARLPIEDLGELFEHGDRGRATSRRSAGCWATDSAGCRCRAPRSSHGLVCAARAAPTIAVGCASTPCSVSARPNPTDERGTGDD